MTKADISVRQLRFYVKNRRRSVAEKFFSKPDGNFKCVLINRFKNNKTLYSDGAKGFVLFDFTIELADRLNRLRLKSDVISGFCFLWAPCNRRR